MPLHEEVLVRGKLTDDGAQLESAKEVEEGEEERAFSSRPSRALQRAPESSSMIKSSTETREAAQNHATGACYFLFCCGCPRKWPRTFGFLFGVILPLLLLVAISNVFGYTLAMLEAPEEIDANDAFLENEARLIIGGSLFTTVASGIPVLCVQLHILNMTAATFVGELMELINAFNRSTTLGTHDFVKEYHDASLAVQVAESDLNETASVLNTSELLDFMIECGNELTPFIERMVSRFVVLASSDLERGMTFNWNRCPFTNGSIPPTDTIGDILIPPAFNQEYLESISPSAQELEYRRQWFEDQQRLYKQYLFEAEDSLKVLSLNLTNTTETSVRAVALDRSIQDATGAQGCGLNTAGSVWFWLTVMSTIGYGNQAPVTKGGRAMVFTLGFLSILVFGALLVLAGKVVTTIVDDFLARVQLHQLRRHAYGWILWTGLAYLWMLVIAFTFQHWRRKRLGADEAVTLGESYWFAFISTTTVGLGDYFLDPTVLTSDDLFYWPLMFLIAFVFFSGFLSILSDKLNNFVGERLSFLVLDLQTPKAPGSEDEDR